MNNKGFAITGVLYTVFVLFLMILIAILIGLNSTNKLAKKSIESLEDDYTGVIYDESLQPPLSTLTTAPCTGKYFFSDNEAKFSFVYLKNGVSIPGGYGTLIRVDCFEEN